MAGPRQLAGATERRLGADHRFSRHRSLIDCVIVTSLDAVTSSHRVELLRQLQSSRAACTNSHLGDRAFAAAGPRLRNS